MNFYKHHLGDYDGATAHLSWDEDMAYTRLLRAYYRRELPIPDVEKHRLCRAVSRVQRAAVDVVLGEFFHLRDGFWHNKRADEEITAYQAQATTNRRIAKTRTVKRTAHESSDESLNEAPTKGTPNQNQEPEAKNQKSSSTDGGIEPSAATQIAVALRPMGVKNASGMNPDVVAWAAAGVTVEQAVEAARMAIEERGIKQPSTGYLTPILNDMRSPPKGRVVTAGEGKPWFLSWEKIVEKGAEKGFAESDFDSPPAFRAAVFAECGITDEDVRKAEADWRVAA